MFIFLADFTYISQSPAIHKAATIHFAVSNVQHVVQIFFGLDYPKGSARVA